MAVYQFVIELIPKKWVKSNKNFCIKLLFNNFDLYDPSIAWEDYSLRVDLESLLYRILPGGKTWHEDLLIWGDAKHNDIQVWFENKKIDSIKIRLDLRENIDNLKKKIIELAKHLDCYFFLPSEKNYNARSQPIK